VLSYSQPFIFKVNYYGKLIFFQRPVGQHGVIGVPAAGRAEPEQEPPVEPVTTMAPVTVRPNEPSPVLTPILVQVWFSI
jgi:hypothetical protein